MADQVPAVVAPAADPRADTREDVLIELQARQLHEAGQAALDRGDLQAFADLYQRVAGLVLLGPEGRAERAFRQAAARAAQKRAGRRRRHRES